MRWLDLTVIALYLIAITWFGSRFKKSQKTLKDYFLGGRSAPWWAIAFSIVSAETSTLTVIGTPALSFRGNFGFLQVVLGYLLARMVISALFLPQYFRGEMFTAYELMQRRFGVAPPAQDHQVIGIGDKASAETSLKAEHLPPQHKPAHVDVRQ